MRIRLSHIVLAVAGLGSLWLCTGSAEDIFTDSYSTVVLDRDGELLGAHIAADEQWRFPLIDSLPASYRLALLTYEDKRFASHCGVDLLAIGRAVVGNIAARRVTSGASTITMQTIRLSRKGKPRNIWQKMVEAVLAVRLELATDKGHILRLYATHAPFGGNVVGLETASWRYFRKSPHHLSVAESAMLAVLPNAPSLIHLSRNRDKLLAKRNGLLLDMLEEKLIDSLDYDLALLEDIPAEPYPLPRLASHLVDHLSMLSTKTAAHHTAIRKSIQTMITDVANYHHSEYSQSGIHNMAVIVLDTDSGEVLGYLGNAPHTTEEGSVDMIQARRSSGSVLKPLLYAHMVDEGELAPDMLIEDVPTHIGGFKPRNYDRQYRGAVSASAALAQSLNVPAVRLLQQYKVDRFLKRTQEMGLTTLDRSAQHYGLSLILGGGEVTLWELAGTYASMGRTLSRYTSEMSRYSTKDFRSPSLMVQNRPEADSYRPPVLSAGAIYHTFEALEEVSRPDQEGSWTAFSSRGKVAWKTGTSFGHRDAWAVGVTGRYTVGIWVGNADGQCVRGLIGSQVAAPVLFDVLSRLPHDRYFEKPIDDMEAQSICRTSGHLAGLHCETRDTLHLAVAVASSPVCPYHQRVHLDRKRQRVHHGCADGDITTESWMVLPPAMEYYYKYQHSDYQSLPPYSRTCEGAEGVSPIAIIYPDESAEIYIPTDLDGEPEKVIVEAVHQDHHQQVFWHLDDEYLGTTKEIHTLDLTADAGRHVLTLIDEQGRQAQRRFTIVGD